MMEELLRKNEKHIYQHEILQPVHAIVLINYFYETRMNTNMW